MKQLNNFINEKLKITTNTNIRKYSYFPKDKEELKEIIKQLIEERSYNANLNDIDTSKITTMHHLFHGLDPHNIDISEWDVSNVDDFECMFWNCDKLDCNLDKWNIKKDAYMDYMFLGCNNLKNKPKWYKK